MHKDDVETLAKAHPDMAEGERGIGPAFARLAKASSIFVDELDLNYVMGEAADGDPKWCERAEAWLKAAQKVRSDIMKLENYKTAATLSQQSSPSEAGGLLREARERLVYMNDYHLRFSASLNHKGCAKSLADNEAVLARIDQHLIKATQS